MNYEDFLRPRETFTSEEIQADDESGTEIEIHKAVVESLAADKAEQEELIANLQTENENLKKLVASLQGQNNQLQEEKEKLRAEKEQLCDEQKKWTAEIDPLKKQIEEQKKELEKVGDILSANSETTLSNKVALLDRDLELPDQFEGETRDHVLEALKEAREQAEKEGRLRHAQLLESVLLTNVPSGNLAQMREKLEKLLSENENILTGPVINELDKLNITYKVGEKYLLADEIIKRRY